jgi:hypothetical protein
MKKFEKLRLRFRDGTICLPVRVNVPSLNQTPVLGLNIELHDNITGYTLVEKWWLKV